MSLGTVGEAGLGASPPRGERRGRSWVKSAWGAEGQGTRPGSPTGRPGFSVGLAGPLFFLRKRAGGLDGVPSSAAPWCLAAGAPRCLPPGRGCSVKGKGSWRRGRSSCVAGRVPNAGPPSGSPMRSPGCRAQRNAPLGWDSPAASPLALRLLSLAWPPSLLGLLEGWGPATGLTEDCLI